MTSVYVEEAEEIQKEVSVLCDVSYANGRVKFLSKYSVPTDADYKVIKAGVVATDSTGYAAIQEVQQELTLDTTATTRLKKYGVKYRFIFGKLHTVFKNEQNNNLVCKRICNISGQ